MSNYTLNWTSNSLKAPFVLQAKTVDLTTTSLALVGDQVANWGERVQENMLHLLENFASTVEPLNPTYGQCWYDIDNNQLKLYTVSNSWYVLWPHPTV